jgi:predicted transcriptional regulator
MSPVKEEAKKLIDRLPDDATWEDVMYRLYVREQIERGMADEREGRVLEHEEVERRILEQLRST